MTVADPIIETIFERLAAQGVSADVADFVLAALSGEDAISEVLAGRPAALPPARTVDQEDSGGIFLSKVEVAGFRGIGPGRTLPLSPKPGLTLVVGRNGSGKSSFAEAIELSLTGNSARWAEKNSIWRGGWRNLHASDPCAIATELHIDGSSVPTRVGRSWAPGADMPDATVTVTDATGTHHDLGALGLARPLALYRPFLTAADLGRLVSGTPSQLFDAIDAILGLDDLTEANRLLSSTGRQLDAQARQVRTGRQELHRAVAVLTDARATRAAGILSVSTPDLDQIDALLAEPTDTTADATVALCRRLAQLEIPDVQHATEATNQLRTAAELAARHETATVAGALRIAELLRLALDHHDAAGDGPCPVCGSGRLDATWRGQATRELDGLRVSTIAANRASTQLTEALRRARQLTTPILAPAGQPPDDSLTAPIAALTSALAVLADAPSAADALVEHLDSRYPAVVDAVTQVRAAATSWLGARDNAWQDTRDQLASWLRAARSLPNAGRLASLKAAATWLKRTAEEIRNDTLRPFAEHAQQIWSQLRQESNVQLGVLTLAGTATRRRVVLPVTVDGADGEAELGVLSQGELHALGLATFLPRSCAKDSPLRFVVIDDPVQSLDPSKVDGLARVLADSATERQVIVFTHDNRLPEAVRRLNIDADIFEVVRGECSAVAIRPNSDPVLRYLDDADALARTRDMPTQVRAPVVAELCRSALEAACQRVVWRKRLARGEKHADIEAVIEYASTNVTKALALAFFDDPDRGGDVLSELNRKHGRRSGDAYQACRQGVHGAYLGELPLLVADIRHLVAGLR